MKQLLKTTSTHKPFLASALLLADVLFFILSDPIHLPFYLMVVGWILIGASVYFVCIYISRHIRRSGIFKTDRHINTVLLSGFVYLVVVLQAVGQLSLRDIAALVPLVTIGYLYFKRSKSLKTAI